MTRVARVAAQAKVNLWLKVGARDGRGYHDIDTLFQRIDLADDVEVQALDRADRTLHWETKERRAADPVPPGRNLAFLAAVAYQDAVGWPDGFAIRLTKRIPIGGGLGGGSADAGAVLRALNRLCPDPIGADDLLRIAGGIGSDVPFLASELVRAVGTGRGERLGTFRMKIPSAAILLVIPGFAIATADAYRWLDESREAGPVPAPAEAARVEFVESKSPWAVVDRGNDFEAVVEQRHPDITRIRAALEAAGARMTRLSGSGSTVFGVFEPGAQHPVHGLPDDALVIPTRVSASVVQVEVLE